MIVQPIPDIIEWLTTTYGQLTEGQLFEREQNLSGLTYEPSQQVDFVFQKLTSLLICLSYPD